MSNADQFRVYAEEAKREKAEKIWVFVKGQKVSEKCASKNRVETQARRKEGSRGDWDGLNGGSRGAKSGPGALQPGGPVTEKLVDAISLEGPAVTLRSPLVRLAARTDFAARVRHLPDERGDGL